MRTAFLDLHLSISNDIVSTKIYDKRDDFDFEIVNFPFLDGDVWERSGSVVECLTRDRGFEPHRRHCVVILE